LFNELDINDKTDNRIKELLTDFNTFQQLDLNELIDRLYSTIEPLFSSKNLNNTVKLKAQEVILYTQKAEQVLFHYSYCSVSLI